MGDGAPRAWTFDCDVLQPGMFDAFFQRVGAPFRIAHLLADPTSPQERLRVAALMLERDGATQLLPADDTLLKPGDRILFVGDAVARRLQQRYLVEPGTVAWVCSGSEPPRGLIFRWWQQRQRPRVGEGGCRSRDDPALRLQRHRMPSTRSSDHLPPPRPTSNSSEARPRQVRDPGVRVNEYLDHRSHPEQRQCRPSGARPSTSSKRKKCSA